MFTTLVVKVTHTLALYKNGDSSPAITTSIRNPHAVTHTNGKVCACCEISNDFAIRSFERGIEYLMLREHTHISAHITSARNTFHVKGSFESAPQNNNEKKVTTTITTSIIALYPFLTLENYDYLFSLNPGIWSDSCLVIGCIAKLCFFPNPNKKKMRYYLFMFHA